MKHYFFGFVIGLPLALLLGLLARHVITLIVPQIGQPVYTITSYLSIIVAGVGTGFLLSRLAEEPRSFTVAFIILIVLLPIFLMLLLPPMFV